MRQTNRSESSAKAKSERSYRPTPRQALAMLSVAAAGVIAPQFQFGEDASPTRLAPPVVQERGDRGPAHLAGITYTEQDGRKIMFANAGDSAGFDTADALAAELNGKSASELPERIFASVQRDHGPEGEVTIGFMQLSQPGQKLTTHPNQLGNDYFAYVKAQDPVLQPLIENNSFNLTYNPSEDTSKKVEGAVAARVIGVETDNGPVYFGEFPMEDPNEYYRSQLAKQGLLRSGAQPDAIVVAPNGFVGVAIEPAE